MSQIKRNIEHPNQLLEEITEHREMFGIPDNLWFCSPAEYRDIVNKGAYFWVDHHESLRHEFSGEILADNQEQVDILIAQLKALRKFMAPAPDYTKEYE